MRVIRRFDARAVLQGRAFCCFARRAIIAFDLWIDQHVDSLSAKVSNVSRVGAVIPLVAYRGSFIYVSSGCIVAAVGIQDGVKFMLAARGLHCLYTGTSRDLSFNIGGSPLFICDYFIYEGNLGAWDVRLLGGLVGWWLWGAEVRSSRTLSPQALSVAAYWGLGS